MKTYIGTKEIKAVPMTSEKALDKGYRVGNNPELDGYEVEYADGYKSWSPGSVFEDSYIQIDGGLTAVHASVVSLLNFFEYKHLPEHLQKISKPFCMLAWKIARDNPQVSETTVALRKLLESKDAAVRAAL